MQTAFSTDGCSLRATLRAGAASPDTQGWSHALYT
jgi:hypothetical protein